ncbi:uncharacterized protein aftphb isoform X2 [Salminus brasiliensis]|uniref:uncharacterized protein aftphb isoform X2 n=1 Tax=Salminus brasiliensis TaxID=930266 RepID=UPI003B82EE97
MEPDVVRLYSSSPPPLDEGGEEEDEDEFGAFGGYCSGVSSSFSFSEFNTATTCSQSHAAESSPPDLHITTPVQDVSSSGKNAASEETEALADNQMYSKPSVSETNVSVDELSEISNGVPPSDLNGAPSVVSSAGQHRPASTSVLQDFGVSSTEERDLGMDGGGRSLSNGPSQLNVGTALGVSTETGLQSRAESSNGPNPPSAASQISRKEVSESGGTVVDEVATQFQEISSNKTDGDQSIDERKEQQEHEDVSTGLQGASGEAVPESGSDDFGDWTESEVEVPGKELCGTTTDLTVKIVPDTEADKVSREVKGTVEMDEDAVGVADFSRTESATQEGFADFVTALSGCSTDTDFGETDTLKDWKEDEELPEEEREEANDDNAEGTWCSALPPSDSFADFSSAPFGGLAGSVDDRWVAFGLQEERESQQDSWAAFVEEQPSIAPSCDGLQNDDVSAGLSCKVQHLLQSTFFPSEVTSEVTEVVTLQTLLEPQDPGANSSHPVQGEAAAMWCHLLDTHSAHGLKVQWVGSRSNRILLDCLGIRNILFTGQKKRPMIVPMFASGLGLLEPTKDPVKPSPTSPAPLTPSSPGQGRSTLCTLVASSLSSREDGVDPELYELTTAKLDSGNVGSNVAEAFNRLMETAERTSTVTRKDERDGAISEEATRVIPLLPDLSFMRARVLMFPYSLNPAANCP